MDKYCNLYWLQFQFDFGTMVKSTKLNEKKKWTEQSNPRDILLLLLKLAFFIVTATENWLTFVMFLFFH